jgi:hypothetical protein
MSEDWGSADCPPEAGMCPYKVYSLRGGVRLYAAGENQCPGA